jgi:hypothetical protein
MKKTILAIFTSAALAFSCDSNRTSERDEDNVGVESDETVEPSTEESDTTSTWDQDRDREHDDSMHDNDNDKDNDERVDDSRERKDTVSTRDDGTVDDQR